MAVRATEVFRAHPECFNEQTLRLLQEHPDLFGEQRIRYVEKVHDSIALNDRREPCVIISASGMCEAGRILHHLKHNIEDPRSTILIVGYQAEGTLGRRLVDRRPRCASWGGLRTQGGGGGAQRPVQLTPTTASLLAESRAAGRDNPAGTVGPRRTGTGDGAGRRIAGGGFSRCGHSRTGGSRAGLRIEDRGSRIERTI